MLEEQNEELRNNNEHRVNLEMKTLEAKLEEVEREKKDLIRTNQITQMKYDRFEQEKEAKTIAKEKIKLLTKEIRDANMEKKRLSEKLSKWYLEISR